MTGQAIWSEWLFDRVVTHWRTTAASLCGAALVIIPVLQLNGFSGKYVTLAGALALAITGALAKDK